MVLGQLPIRSESDNMAYPQSMFPYPVNPVGLQNCIYHFTYMWLRNGDNFWFFLTAVGESRAYGYRFLAGDGISIQLDCVKFVPTIVLRYQRYIEIKATELPFIWAAFCVVCG